MVSIRTTGRSLFVLMIALALAGPVRAQQDTSGDEKAIRALLERVNLAMNADTAEKGVEIMRGVISDKGYTVVIPNGEKPTDVFVGDKKALCDGLAQSIRSGQRWGAHKVRQIVIVGPVAYEIGDSASADPNAPTTPWLNVFAKEDVGWRFVFGTPAADALKALRQLDAGKAAPR